MQHVAIDLGSRESQVCVRSETGEIISERRVVTTRLAALLSKQPHSSVILETSAEAFCIADAARKAGASDLRFALVQGAWTLLRCRPNEPMSRWALRIAERRNRKIAVIALARKLVGVLWSMWQHGSDYDASKTSSEEVV